MLRKRKGLLAILLILGTMLVGSYCLTQAASVSRTVTPPPEPDADLLINPGSADRDLPPLLGQGAFPCKHVLFLDDRLSSAEGSYDSFSTLKSTLIGLGFEVQEILPLEISTSLIAPYDIVVFSLGWYAGGGGQRELTDAEAAVLVEYVKSGKSLFLVGELGRASWSGKWRKSLNRISRNFGITFANNMLCSTASHLNDPADPDGGVDLPVIQTITSRFLGEGVKQFSILWGSTLQAQAPARIVSRSDASSWRDNDCTWNFVIGKWECEQDADQPSGTYGVLAVVDNGAGRILAVGDSSWMVNGWIEVNDNLQLAKNAFTWLARQPAVKSLTAKPTSGSAPLRVSLTCSTKDPGTHVKEYLWDFNGDGTTDEATPSGSPSITISHTYAAAGTFATTCTIVDTNGCSSTASPVTIAVSANRPPVIDSFDAEPSSGIGQLRVSFTCAAHDPDRRGSITNYLFAFGDGNTTTSPNGTAFHTYAVGTYNATCTAVDNQGAQTTSSPVAITVQANQPPVIDSFTANPQAGNAPLRVSFLCSAHDPDGSISYYVLNFGDGNTTISTSGDGAQTYSIAGTYNTTCTAVDNRGAQTTSSPLPVAVNGPPFITSYTATEVAGVCDNATQTRPYSFTCSASDPESSIARYVIAFGDDQSSTVTTSNTTVTVLHSYTFHEGSNLNTTQCTVFDDQNATATSAPVTVQVHTCD